MRIFNQNINIIIVVVEYTIFAKGHLFCSMNVNFSNAKMFSLLLLCIAFSRHWTHFFLLFWHNLNECLCWLSLSMSVQEPIDSLLDKRTQARERGGTRVRARACISLSFLSFQTLSNESQIDLTWNKWFWFPTSVCCSSSSSSFLF